MPTENEIPTHYPSWLHDFFNAETDKLAGYVNDWWGAEVSFDEDGYTLTIYSGNLKEIHEARFYGTKGARRLQALRYLSSGFIADALAYTIIHGRITASPNAQTALRLHLSASYGNQVFGGPWE